MPRPLLAFALVVLTLGGPRAGAAAPRLADLVDRVRPAVVGVGLANPLGAPRYQLGATGFAIGDGHTIVTNSHVVAGVAKQGDKAKLVVFVGRGPRPSVRPAIVLHDDPTHDLAVLRIPGDPVPALTLADGTPVREGTEIVFTGFPIGAVLGLYPVTHRGIVSSIVPIAIPQPSAANLTAAQIKRLQQPFDMYQLDATAYPGNSGSPLVDQDSGQVIGVLNSVLAKQGRESVLKDPSAITYAIPVRFLHELLDRR